MAGSEGSVGGQTELLTGWSCVVHRPSEDPEPSSLPSTVDIAAFSSGPSLEPTHSPLDNCCTNSDSDSGSDSENSLSDASGSCSYSSSDTDSSTSSQGSSSSSTPPHFSVTSSQTNGLRLTIATVRKSCSSPNLKDESQSSNKEKEVTKPSESTSKSKPADARDINTVKKDVTAVKKYINVVKRDATTVKRDVNAVKRDVNTIKRDVNAVKRDVNAVKKDINAVKRDDSTVKRDVNAVKRDDSTVKRDVNAVKREDSTVKRDVNAVKRDDSTVKRDVNAVIKNFPSPKLTSSDSESECLDSDSSSESESQVKNNVTERNVTERNVIERNGNERKVTSNSNVKRDSPTSRVKCLRRSAKVNSKVEIKSESVKKCVKRDSNSKISKCPTRGRGRPPIRKKMACLPVARVSSPNATSSDSDESDSDTNSAMLASCSLQEIRQEDLAAILPDQQDCDAFGGFECEARTEKAEADPDVADGSGSEMELPTQLVNAAIQRVTESSSETESQPAIYASTLLQQFVQQTQLLNNAPIGSTLSSADITEKQSSSGISSSAPVTNDNVKGEIVKRKRGRPRKNISKKSEPIDSQISCNNLLNGEYSTEPNVSPDSGIPNSPDHISSPEPSPSLNGKNKIDPENTKTKEKQRTDMKSIKNKPISSNNNVEKAKDNGRINDSKVSSKGNKVDSLKQKIIPKQKMALTCNNLDRVLYANADRVLYPPRRKVGRPAGKVGIRKPGRPPKHRNENPVNVDTENVDTENVTPVNRCKNEKQPKVQKVVKSTHKIDKKSKKSNKSLNDSDIVQLTSNTHSLSLGKSTDIKKSDSENVNSVPKKIKPSGALLNEICERVSKRLELNNKCQNKPVLQTSDENSKPVVPTKSHKVCHNVKHPKTLTYLKNKAKLNALKSKLTTFKHMKVMHTKHKHKKHKKHKIKILKTISTQSTIPKVDTDIDKLILDFVKYCNLGTHKSQKENLPEIFHCVKRISKKRKVESTEGRKKKKQSSSNSGETKETNSNEQRLPLKKRHYHASVNSENKSENKTENKNENSKEEPIKPVDTKTNAKNNIVNNNKSTVIAKTAPEKTKTVTSQKDQNLDSAVESPNKSPSQALNKIENKSVLVMNKTQTNSQKSANNNNNNNKKHSDSEDIIGTHIDEAIEACITRYTSPVKLNSSPNKPETTEKTEKINSPETKPVPSITATTPKKRHRMEIEKMENSQQIEKAAKKLDVNSKVEKSEPVPENKTAPLENVVSELKTKKIVSPPVENKKPVDKKIETVAQMITRKKNRLEDLASNLVSKMNTSAATEALDSLLTNNLKKTGKKVEDDTQTRASVIKSPVAKKIKPAENDKLLDSIVDDKPTGIFLQTVDLELHIPATTIQTVQNNQKVEVQTPVSEKTEKPTDNQHNLRNKKPVDAETKNKKPEIETTNSVQKIKKAKTPKDIVVQVEKLKEITPENSLPPTDKNKPVTVVKKKIKRRKAINRTGFPTLKKKKKKIVPQQIVTKTPKNESRESEIPEIENTEENNIYDRVPRLGEEASTFMKRTQTCTLSVVSLEKLQAKAETLSTFSTLSTLSNVSNNDETDLISKWEVSSECDSLPIDECTFTSELESIKSVKSERPFSRLDIKQERMSLRLRDVSPATSVETRSSDRTKKKSRDVTPDIKNRDEEYKEKIKHRTRDSSAGSVQTVDEYEKKIKRKRDDSVDKSEKKKKIVDDGCSFKRRLRDISPASSIEPLPCDKKQRSDSVASSSGDDSKRSKKVPRWRKKYLVAGLFSDYYKEDDELARVVSTKTRLVYKPDEHPYGLLPPPYHCGRWLRCRKVAFQLPYDLWWQHTHSQLPGRDLVPSWNYRKIRTNVYCVRAPSGACEPQACNCSTSSGCEDDCINRLVLAECPSTHKCRNQRIQRHEWAPGLEKFMTENKGWGVRTKQSIKTGEFILEYVGEVVSDQEFKQRMATRYAHDTHHYCLHLDGGLVIDGHRMGGDGRFVNHSCQPNCEMQKWSVNGQFRMALFALRDISPDEELTYDYNFSLFNPAEGQVCKCGNDNCRGVIGGKSQRVRQSITNTNQTLSETNNNQVGRVGRPRKNQARRATSGGAKEIPTGANLPQPGPVTVTPQIKPMTHQQKCFALQHHCFLLRNLDKVKRLKERSVTSVARSQQLTQENNSNFLNQLNALRQPRNMRTRRLAQAQDNPELNKTARLASVLRDLCDLVTSAKDENNEQLCSPFINLPSKRKLPEYYQRISDPIDLTIIEQNIGTGVYRTVEAFDNDMNRLFANSVRFFGRTSELGIAATRLRKVYGQGKLNSMSKLEDVLGEKPPNTFVGGKDPGDEEEDVIRCICGLYRDEGLMIQCERCLVWQHCECVRADPAAPSYHCERCHTRPLDLEIPLDEYHEQGHRYYMSLLRGDLQLRQGDTVYVLRDIPIEGTDKKHTYNTIGEVQYTDMDIFRIERLWKDQVTGQRHAFGHHYLRPHETYHEPTRKFFQNEVMRVPLYEVVPIELIMSPCWVLDLNTYCKGRPIGSIEEHVYICEYRVDKTARLFSKISKSKYPVCTKSYAFERFDVRLKISRTFTPHELDNIQVKPRGRRPHENDENHSNSKEIKENIQSVVQEPIVPVIRTREEQRAHLNGILLKLLGRLPSKQALDVSYLLEGGRRRKKQQS